MSRLANWRRPCVLCLCSLVPLAISALLVPPLRAHGDLHERIAALTKQIAKDPGNANLYLKRGELYRAHREWKPALADYAKAARLKPSLGVVDLCRGLTFLAAERPKEAKEALDRFLIRQPDHSQAQIARARALVKLGDGVAAARDYSRVLARQPNPEHYLERARALAAEGRKEEAIAGLDEGITRLGPLATVQLYAITLELEQSRYDAALARLETLAAQTPRKETWLARRGEILEAAGRPSEAREAYAAAVASIASVPEMRRKTRAMEELEMRLQRALERLDRQLKGQR